MNLYLLPASASASVASAVAVASTAAAAAAVYLAAIVVVAVAVALLPLLPLLLTAVVARLLVICYEQRAAKGSQLQSLYQLWAGSSFHEQPVHMHESLLLLPIPTAFPSCCVAFQATMCGMLNTCQWRICLVPLRLRLPALG